MPEIPIHEVLARHRERLHALPGVVGVGEGALPDGRACVLVMVDGGASAAAASLPASLDGYPVEVRATGAFEARGEEGS